MQSDKKIVFRNISSLFLVQVANYLLPIISLPVIVRIIGPENFGIINYSAAIVTYFVLLINYGFNLTASRKIARQPDNHDLINQVFSEVLFAKICLFIISFVMFWLALVFIPQMHEHAKVMWFSFIICLAWVITPDWLFQGIQELHKTAYLNLATKIIFTILILLLIRRKEDYYLHPLAYGLAQFFVGIFSWRYAISRLNIKIAWPGLARVKSVLWEDRIIFISSIIMNLYTTTSVVLLGAFSNSSEVGYFSAAQKFIIIIQTLIGIPFSQSLFPFIGKSFGIDKEEGLSTVRKLFPIITYVSFLVSCMIWLLGPLVIELFYGSSFLPSKHMFRIMAFTPFIVILSNFLGIQIMLNLNMDRPFLKIIFVGSLLNLVVSSVLSTKMGGVGTSYSILITESFITILMIAYLIRQNILIIKAKSFNPLIIANQFRMTFLFLKK